MNAYQCDRCRSFFKLENTLHRLNISKYKPKSYDTKLKEKDLCPKCTDELIEWLEEPAQKINREG